MKRLKRNAFLDETNLDELKRQKKKYLSKLNGNRLRIIRNGFLPEVLLYLTISALKLAGMIDEASMQSFFSMRPECFYLFYSLVYIATIIVPFIILIPIYNIKKSEILPTNATNTFGKGILIVAALCGICAVSNIIGGVYITVLNNVFRINVEIADIAICETFVQKIMYIVTLAILPAIAEEFVFRGILLSMLRKYGDVFAIVVSSGAFAVMHGNLLQIPFAFLCGLAFAYITVRYNDIRFAMAAHFVNNLTGAIQGLLPETNVNLQTIFLAGTYLLIFVAAIAAIFVISRKEDSILELPSSTNGTLTEKQKVIQVLKNPIMIAVLVLYGLLIYTSTTFNF